MGVWSIALGVPALGNYSTDFSIVPGTFVEWLGGATGHYVGYFMAWGVGTAGLLMLHWRLKGREREHLRQVDELRFSVERWRCALEAVGDGVWDWNAANDSVYFSPRWKSILGYTEDEISDRFTEWESRVHPDDHARMMASVAAHLSGLTPVYESEHRLRCKDGSYKWILDRGQIVMRASDGKPMRIIGTHRDLSVQKQAEASQMESEQRYRQLLASITDYVFSVEMADGRLVATTHSPGCFAVTGYTAAEFTANPRLWIEMVPAEQRKAIIDHADAPQCSELGFPLEHQIQRKDGSTRWVRSTLVPRRGGAGKLVAYDGLVQDITTRKLAEESLRLSEEKFASLFQHAPVWIMLIDLADSTVLEINDQALRDFGYTRAEVVGRSSTEVVGIRAEERALLLQHLQERGRVDGFEMGCRTKDGRELYGEVSGGIVSIAGRKCSWQVTVDVTARKQAECHARENAERLQQFFEEMLCGVMICELIYDEAGAPCNHRFLHGNRAFEQLTGLLVQDLVGKSSPDLAVKWPPDITRRLYSVAMTGQPITYERFNESLDRVYETRVFSPRRGQFAHIFNDVTLRKQAESELRQSHEMILKLAARVPGVVYQYRLDPDGRSCFPYASQGLTGIYEFSPEEVREDATPVFSRLHPDDLERVAADIQESGRTLQHFHCEFRVVLPRQGLRWRLCDAVPERTVDGGTLWHGIILDITERRNAENALRESEARYRTLVDLSPELVLVHAGGRIVFVNAAGAKLLGASAPSDLINRPILERIHPDFRDHAAGRLDDVLRDGTTIPLAEEKWLRLDGEAVDFAVTVTRVPYEGQAALLVVAHDDTARRAAEVQLRKLSRAVEQSPVTVVITDALGNIEYVNPSFTSKTGYTFEEVRGTNPKILNSGKQTPELYHEMWRTIASGGEWRGEFRNRKKNGELFWEAATISPITDEAGRITHYLAVKEDITEQKAAEERISEQAALLEVTRDIIITVDLSEHVMYWNHGAELVYGWTADEVRGKSIHSLIYDTEHRAPKEAQRVILEGGEWSGELRQRTKSGTRVTVLARGTLLRTPNGEPQAMLLTGTDISESKRLEAQFLRVQRLESLGSLASGVAHDLNNVLTPILMAATMLAEERLEPRERELIQLLENSAQRGADIVQQLLLFGRGSDSPRAPMKMAIVINELMQLMSRTFPKTIAFASHVPKDLGLIDGDPTQVHQVLLNLCVNARDAMPAGGTLSLVAENVQVDPAFAASQIGARPGPYLLVRVRDSGTGISPEFLDKIFDPFFTTKPTGHGTGLGLATVFGIVRSHGGFVVVDSEVGSGTEFGVYLPVSASEAKTQPTAQIGANLRGGDELVLVIDDDAAIRQTLSKLLSNYGYRVVTASDGADGVSAFVERADDIKLVITDMVMPVMDGAQAIRALRRIRPGLPVIALSGLASQRDGLEASFGPHIQFLAKPFFVEQVLKVVRELINNESQPASSS